MQESRSNKIILLISTSALWGQYPVFSLPELLGAHRRSSFTLMAAVCLFYRFPLCDHVDGSPSGFSVHGILQARIIEWVAISFSRGSSLPRDWTHISWISCIAGRFFTTETWEARYSFPEFSQGSIAHHRQWLQLLITANIFCLLIQQAVFHFSE